MKILLRQDIGEYRGMVVAEQVWSVLINNLAVNAITRRNSAGLDVKGATGVQVLLTMDSTLAPTNLRILQQFGLGRHGPWFDMEEGFWASLMWEDVDLASGVAKGVLAPVSGHDWVRWCAIGTGTDGANFFTLTLRARAFFGPSIVAHA